MLPLFHSFGQTVIQNGSAAYGGTVVMLPRFEAGAALELMQSEGITFFAGVPTMYWGLLGALKEAGDKVDVGAIKDNLRVAVAGGAALPVEVHKDVRAEVRRDDPRGLRPLGDLPGRQLLAVRRAGAGRLDRQAGPGCRDEADRARAAGTRSSGRTDAIGEIAIKGHNIMKGYYGRPDATDEAIKDGWFRSGDLGRRDEDGWYYIVDRSKDMIIRGGYNVYPREIEEVLMTHPDVSLAAVIGVPHESHGEEIKAVVILEDGATVTEDELVAWGKEQMAAYKYPRVVEFVPSLPMTATGKILKRELS